ncbi:MAG: hypothetical protein RLZZ628_4033 [Bacteroidota bacterium]|jgi:hypothetical protein
MKRIMNMFCKRVFIEKKGIIQLIINHLDLSGFPNLTGLNDFKR